MPWGENGGGAKGTHGWGTSVTSARKIVEMVSIVRDVYGAGFRLGGSEVVDR